MVHRSTFSRLAKRLRRHLRWWAAPWLGQIPRGHYLALGIVLALCVRTYATQDLSSYRTADVTAHGDGRYYYVYLRSLAFDHDLRFENDYKLLGNPFEFKKSKKTGRYTNKFTIGPALYWGPFLALAHGTYALTNALHWTDVRLDGTDAGYQRVVFFGSLFWGAAALLIFLRLARRYGRPRQALVAALATLAATPLLWFMIRQASFSHAISAFAVACFVAYWHRTLFARTRRQWFVLGLLLGLAALVRPQNVGHVVLALGEWILLAVAALQPRPDPRELEAWEPDKRECAARESDRREGRRLGGLVLMGFVFVAGVLLAFLPQMIAWLKLQNWLLLIPQGKSFMHWTSSRWEAVLFSSRAGLFAWHPLVYLSVIGLGLLALLRPRAGQPERARLVGALMLAAFVVQVYLNGAAKDWHGGWAFGGRRFLSCSVYFAVGLTVFFERCSALLARLGKHLLVAAPAMLAVVFTLLNLGLMDAYLDGSAKHDVAQPLQPVWRKLMDEGYDAAYKRVGNLGSIPANWVFAMRAGTHPSRYDLISGVERVDEKQETLNFAGAGIAYSGFGEPTKVAGQRCRFLAKKRGTFVIGLRDPHALMVMVGLKAANPDTRVEVSLRGQVVLDVKVAAGWQLYPFFLPKALTRAGLNYLRVRQRFGERPPHRLGAAGTSTSAESTLVELTPVELTVESGGYAHGRKAVFVLAGKTLVEQRRGVAMMAIAPGRRTAAPLRVFDTFGHADAAERLRRAIARLPPKTLVALAVVDEASRKWSAAGQAALKLIGAKTSLVKKYRCSYVAIGVKGARPGSAVEQLACRGRATRFIGRPAGQRQRGVGWGVLWLHRVEP